MGSTPGEVLVEIMAGLKLHSEEVREHVREIGEKGVAFGQAVAPVYAGEERADVTPGAFRDSIHYEDLPDRDGMPAGQIISRNRIAHLLEFGWIHHTGSIPETGTFAQIAHHLGGTGPDHIDAADIE